MSFWIQITDSTSIQYGEIRTAEYWRGTHKRDADGEFEFAMPASDPNSALVVKHRIARCFSIYENAVTEVGAMIIDKKVLKVDGDGKATFVVSGNGVMRGLVYRHVGNLSIGSSGSPTTGGPSSVMALAQSGWSLDTVNGYSASQKAINHDFEGETVLAALVKVAELTGEHFRQGSTAFGDFKIVWMQDDMTDSGVRLVQAVDPIAIATNPDVALITSLEVEEDSFDGYIGRVYARGSGDGSASVDLNGASSPATGYSIGNDSKGYYLQHDATWASYGIEVLQVWPDDADQATLLDDAYEWLKRRIGDAIFYRVQVAKLDQLLTVGSTVRLIFRGWTESFQWADVDEDLVILSLTVEVDNSGLRTTELEVVSTSVDRERETNASAILSGLGTSESYVYHTQPIDGGDITAPIDDAYYPNAILRDGSRSLLGNLTVAAAVTIDGVDLSDHVLQTDVHHIALVGLKDNAGTNVSPSASDYIQIAAGPMIDTTAGSSILTVGLTPGSAQYQILVTGSSPFNPAYVNLSTFAGSGLFHSAGVLSIVAGPGLTVTADGVELTAPGTLTVSTGNVSTGSHTHAITASADVKAVPDTALLKSDGSGGLALASVDVTDLLADNVDSHLIPKLTDTYDLGDSTHLWRKGWLSEMEALLFVENTITLLGGWFWIPKDAGTLPFDVNAVINEIDFGKAMTTGDFVVFRSSLQVEYMTIGSLVGGTTYGVSRSIDGSGPNVWPAGQPFAVLGQSGAGRIELNAYDTPRIQMIRQGATYNSQTELIRLGDLNGGWGYATETWGLAMGEYAAGYANITIDPTNGLRLRSYNTTIIHLDNAGNAEIAGSLTIGASGGIYQADGDVWLDDGGLGFDYTIGGDTSSVKWLNSGVVFASIVGKALSGARGMAFVAQRYEFFDGSTNQLVVHTSGLEVTSDVRVAAGLYVGSLATDPGIGEIYATSDVRIGGGLYVGSVATNPPVDDILVDGGLSLGGASSNPATGNLNYTGNLTPRRSSVDYTGYIFVPLSTPLTAAAFTVDSFSTLGKTLIDTSVHFGAPANIKAVLVSIGFRDSGSAGSDCYIILSPNNTAGSGLASRCSGLPNDTYANATVVVPCNVNGDIYYQIQASGSGTFEVTLQIWGYWI